MPSTVSVEAALVATVASAHQFSTGIWAASRRSISKRTAPASASMRAKLWITGTLPSVSAARSAKAVW